MKSKFKIRWQLVAYDSVILVFTYFLLLFAYRGSEDLSYVGVLEQSALSAALIMTLRFIGKVYGQIWRYGGVKGYVRIIITDSCAFLVTLVLERVLPIEHITFARLLSMSAIILLGSLAMRIFYRYAYQNGSDDTRYRRILKRLVRVFAGKSIECEHNSGVRKINIAIIGAGNTGVSLAQEILDSSKSPYELKCFIEKSNQKIDRSVRGIPVISDDQMIGMRLSELGVRDVVIAIPNIDEGRKKLLYQKFSGLGYGVKIYDYPYMHTAKKKSTIREFDIEELLFRNPIAISSEKTTAYYRDKTILITGGGGSIGSELCRRLSEMKPKKIVVIDIYENGAYDIQQELKIAYAGDIDFDIEIVSITNRQGLVRAFEKHHPQIVINAAAHKHVPLMENNCIEAVENNVFGTYTLVSVCEEFNVESFIMVSTDKAVNPTNVMGATKRMCEMIVLSASRRGKVKYSVVRFGNVLGSAGSVVPLFKKQIANGGPITVTDKRIIRYFMTIPEASQLVLESGALAKNGELMVLDMGQPVKILDLAQSMIKLSGAQNIEIVETGLRPGEKLYEELLVKTEELDKTENNLIFIERDTPITQEQVEERLSMLKDACKTQSDAGVRKALKKAIPTFRSPNEVNKEAEESMRL